MLAGGVETPRKPQPAQNYRRRFRRSFVQTGYFVLAISFIEVGREYHSCLFVCAVYGPTDGGYSGFD